MTAIGETGETQAQDRASIFAMVRDHLTAELEVPADEIRDETRFREDLDADSLEDEAAGQGAAVEPLLELIGELDADARLQALTHSSWTDRRISSWGRLAFLGDSVLGLAVAEHLYERFPRTDIGRLTKIHGQAVSGRACAEIAVALGVPGMLERAYPDDFEGGLAPAELVGSERAMASIVESLIGACYLQFGLDRTAEALLAAFAPQVDLASGTLLDF